MDKLDLKQADSSADESMMRLALAEAVAAAGEDEVPVGAVIVRGGEVIAAAHNRCESARDATCHAEMLAVREACRILGRKRLSDCTLYVTLEPCPMCAGVLSLARIGEVVFGAKDPVAGACGSLLNLPRYPNFGNLRVRGGVLTDACRMLLSDFFEKKRKNRATEE